MILGRLKDNKEPGYEPQRSHFSQDVDTLVAITFMDPGFCWVLSMENGCICSIGTEIDQRLHGYGESAASSHRFVTMACACVCVSSVKMCLISVIT